MTRRYAEVRGASARVVAKFLPANYQVDGDSSNDASDPYAVVCISGEDHGESLEQVGQYLRFGLIEYQETLGSSLPGYYEKRGDDARPHA